MKQGDIVVIEFPFSNIAEKKLRPALVISNSHYNRYANVLLAGIYGKKQPLSVALVADDVRSGTLRKSSHISLQNIFSADKLLIRHTVGTLTAAKLKEVLTQMQKCV